MDPDNRDFLKLLLETEAGVNALLAILGAGLFRAIRLNARRPARLRKAIDQLIEDYVNSYQVLVTDAVINTAGLQADKNAAKLVPLLQAAGAVNEAERMGRNFRGYREVIRRRFPTQRHPEDEQTFVNRVVNVRRGFQRTVYQMVQTGVDQGTDPRKLAFQIRDFVVMTPKAQPSQSYRDAARLRNRASTYVARGAPSGSIQYNSMRIVRTEMAGVYRRSVTDFYDDRPYTEGFDWVRSNRHTKIDRCDGWAEGGPYTAQNIPPGHPHCLCRLVARSCHSGKLWHLLPAATLIEIIRR